MSKVINLKAIHNYITLTYNNESTVSNVSKVINLKAIHNDIDIQGIRFDDCFQCVKGNKFESDSQLDLAMGAGYNNCFQCVKGNKFESDSQLIVEDTGNAALFPMCQR